MTQTPANHPAPTVGGGWCAPYYTTEELAPLFPAPAPAPDLPRLRKVLDHIDAYPDQHDQRWWVARRARDTALFIDLGTSSHVGCGTTRCLAGWVEWLEDGVTTADRTEARATELLGLTPQEANELFFSTALYGDHDDQRAAIQRVAERIAARAGERL